MEHRVRLDGPTLAEPLVRDLLQESDLFARSFSGGGFGFISPLDFINIFSLLVEILSHLWLILTLTRDASCFGVLLFSIASAVLPFFLSRFAPSSSGYDDPISAKEARAAEKQERMRNLAYSDAHRPEVSLFGLGDWILSQWSAARKVVLASEQPLSRTSNVHLADLMYALQNVRIYIVFSYKQLIPPQLPFLLILQTTNTTLGAITAYRTSIQCALFAAGNLVSTVKMAFQGLFLMSAFSASIKLKPRMQPKHEDLARYMSRPGGASIDVKYVWSLRAILDFF